MYFNIINLKKVNFQEKRYLLGTSVCYTEIIIMGVLSLVINESDWKIFEKYFLMLIITTFLMGVLLYYANVVYFYMDKITQKNILLHVAYTDYLTGLENRAKYEEHVEELKNKDLKDIIVISFDLDNLKKINDQEGHDAGDMYIKTFAKALKKNLEQYGFIGRIGGDEFCSIINDKTLDIQKGIRKRQELFMNELKDEIWNDKVSFSYGYAYGNELDESDIEELINLADKRMYEFKSESKKGRDM
jgi:diguanylate cyclase (GGDEF)-like protein